MSNIKKILRVLFVIVILLAGVNIAYADPTDINLTIRDGNTIIFPSSNVSIQPGDSVLTALDNADQADPSWSISDLQHYSFGDYIKCITSIAGNHCDNWQYTVNGSYPFASIDQNTLSGGENIYLFFGPKNKVILSSNSITTAENLEVTTQDYDYQNNDWVPLTGVTVGLTQPDPNNPWSPIEVQTNAVDANGQAIFSEILEGSYNVGIQEDYYTTIETLIVTTPPPPPETPQIISSGSRSRAIIYFNPKPTFDLQKAFSFLSSQQKADGSFGEEIYTDWATIALSSNSELSRSNLDKLAIYLAKNKLTGTLLTDYERHAMALMSLGMNPYYANGENYIEKITSSFDGTQFGNTTQGNDDIFALIVLQNAGYMPDEKIITDTINFILSKQKENGSWDENVDMTGAGMEALGRALDSIQTESKALSVKNALQKAKEYLKQNQKDDGGFGNVSSTAWAMEGILGLGEKIEDWTVNGNTPINYLGENQDEDGSVKADSIQNKIWQTSYILTSLSGKTWNEIMQKFEKPKTEPKTEVTQVPQKEIIKTETKKIVKVIKNDKKKLESLATQIVASPITATINNPVKEKIPEPVKKENWFKRFFRKIFGF